MQITIQRDIPAPGKGGEGRYVKYPFRAMDVGDSFFVPNGPINLYNSKAYLPKKFTRRTVVENGVKGIRVWRIE